MVDNDRGPETLAGGGPRAEAGAQACARRVMIAQALVVAEMAVIATASAALYRGVMAWAYLWPGVYVGRA